MPCRPISNSNTAFSFNLNLNSNLCEINEKKSNLYVNDVRLRLRHSSNLAASRNFRWILVAFFLAGCICSWGWCPHFESLPDYLHRGLRDRSSRIISDSCSPCTASPDGSFCTEEKRNALRTGDESGIPIFVPECREDGGYKQVQCHKGNNFTIS